MTRRTPQLALCSLIAAALMPDVGSAAREVNERLISEMTQELQSAQVVTLEHDIEYTVPVSFTTKLPCRLRVPAGSFEKKHGRETVARFATALGVSQLSADARDFRGTPCRRDTTRTDNVTLTFGKGKKAVRARIDLDGGTASYLWRDSVRAMVSLGKKSENVRQLLMQSMPADSFLAAIRPCDRTDPEEPGAPFYGNYVWVEELPEAIERVPPVYPEKARLKGVSGEVRIQALISKTGTVVSTIIIRSIPALDEAAVRAVEQWRFRPAMTDGAPTAVWVAIPVKFKLR